MVDDLGVTAPAHGRRGLLHRLSRSSRPEQPVDVIESVVENLRALLNSDEGSCASSPDFGVSLHDALTRWDSDKRKILVEIGERIASFEPRLQDITVTGLPESNDLKFNVLIEATLPDGRPFRARTDMAVVGDDKVKLTGDL